MAVSFSGNASRLAMEGGNGWGGPLLPARVAPCNRGAWHTMPLEVGARPSHKAGEGSWLLQALAHARRCGVRRGPPAG